MWIVFGTRSELARVPDGLKVERRCGSCGETATFYEKQATKTFRLYFIDVFDYERHRVMACGCCGAYYATDELGVPGKMTGERNLINGHVGRTVERVGSYVERAGSAVSDGLSSLLSGGERRSTREQDGWQSGARGESRSLEDAEIDKEIAGIGVDDDMEARFRALEEKARKGQ